jgi:signal transduction histidine kinase
MGKLFQPFQRIDMSLEKSYTEGTGLGLYLTRNLANLLRGNIRAKSEYRKGSEFTFTVPLRYEGENGK